VTDPAHVNPSPFTSVSLLLAWLAKRAAPFTALSIGIAAILWSEFRHEFALPIGFASASVLTALPALMAIVATAAGILAWGLAMPGQVLTTRLRPDGPTLASLLRTPIDPETGQRTNVRASRILDRYWVGSAVASGLSWVGVIAWETVRPATSVGWGFLVVFTGSLLLTAVGSPVLKRALGEAQPCGAGFLGMLLLGHVAQSYVAFFVVFVILKMVGSASAIDLALGGVCLLIIMVFAAFVQMALALRLIRGWYPNVLKHLVCLAFLVVGVVSMVPPVGARLASLALLSSATPDRPCSILLLNDDITTTTLRRIADEGMPGQSRPMRVVFPFDSVFYVKESIEAPTFIVDAKNVGGTMACPPLHLPATPPSAGPKSHHTEP